jgi:hypothetical protein
MPFSPRGVKDYFSNIGILLQDRLRLLLFWAFLSSTIPGTVLQIVDASERRTMIAKRPKTHRKDKQS